MLKPLLFLIVSSKIKPFNLWLKFLPMILTLFLSEKKKLFRIQECALKSTSVLFVRDKEESQSSNFQQLSCITAASEWLRSSTGLRSQTGSVGGSCLSRSATTVFRNLSNRGLNGIQIPSDPAAEWGRGQDLSEVATGSLRAAAILIRQPSVGAVHCLSSDPLAQLYHRASQPRGPPGRREGEGSSGQPSRPFIPLPIKGFLSERLYAPKKGMFILPQGDGRMDARPRRLFAWHELLGDRRASEAPVTAEGSVTLKAPCGSWGGGGRGGRAAGEKGSGVNWPLRGGLGRASWTFRSRGKEMKSDCGQDRPFAWKLWQPVEEDRKDHAIALIYSTGKI